MTDKSVKKIRDLAAPRIARFSWLQDCRYAIPEGTGGLSTHLLCVAGQPKTMSLDIELRRTVGTIATLSISIACMVGLGKALAVDE